MLRRSMMVLAVGLVAGLSTGGCDCSGGFTPGEVCATDPAPASCGLACSTVAPCPIGYYCDTDDRCTADCDTTTPCPNDGVCNISGMCELPDAGSENEDGARRDSSNICADVMVTATRVTPNVILIIDQSASMDEDFGGSDRWNALRDSLLDNPDGLIFSLQSQVRFGVALYSAEADGDGPVLGECPVITYIPPAIDNYNAIETIYSGEDPIDETPTGEAIDEVLATLMMTPDPSTDPTIFIVATDGEPDTCAQPNPQNGQMLAVEAVDRALLAGIRTFIISVGSDISINHLQDMANAGVGSPAGTDADFWVAGDDLGLRTALTDIVGGELSCTVGLDGMIEDLTEACSGTVRLNGEVLPCDDPNGWRAIDPNHIELQGDACTLLQSGPGVSLNATFPCDVILI